MEPFIGQIILFAGRFAPKGWAFCDGQMMSIPQNSSLFSILGTTYGGDGVTTFRLPDLRGRAAIHPGTGPGLSPLKLGETGGSETVTIGAENLPIGDGDGAGGVQAAKGGASDQPVPNREPFQCVNYIIATQGIYPQRP